MDTKPPIVLWVDEDQGKLRSVEWRISKCGAVVERALSAQDGIAALARFRPNVVILDAIVALGGGQSGARYAGTLVWDAMDEGLRHQTIILSLVPYSDLSLVMAIPEDRVFWKGDLNKDLDRLEATLRSILLATQAQESQVP